VPGWPKAPKLLEEVYNFEDALVVGGALIVLMNNADRVKTACLAQLVNVIGPIMTETGGDAWRQTIFYPFADASRLGHGEVLRLKIDTTTFATKAHGEVPHLLATAIRNPETGAVGLLVLNRGQAEMRLDLDLKALGESLTIASATELHNPDLKKANTQAQPNAIVPAANGTAKIAGHRLTATLKPLSWNVFSLT
jgi:alpha-N-arabinofuranosidase